MATQLYDFKSKNKKLSKEHSQSNTGYKKWQFFKLFHFYYLIIYLIYYCNFIRLSEEKNSLATELEELKLENSNLSTQLEELKTQNNIFSTSNSDEEEMNFEYTKDNQK